MMNFRQEAYSTILKVLKDHEFSDTLLHQRAKKLRSSGEGVSQFYTLVKGVIKYKLKLEYILSHHTDPRKFAGTDLKIKVLLYIGLYQLIHMDSIPEHAALNETVELAKSILGGGIADFVNAVLRSYQRNPKLEYPEDPVKRISLEHSYPEELIHKWIQLWGEEDTEYMALFFNEVPKLHLRVNQTATSTEKLIQYFAKRNIVALPSEASRMMLTTEQGEAVLNDVAFSEGYFSVQDTSAALIVELLDPKEGESVLDLFSAPGGKCTYIAESLGNSGEVIAVDKIPNKMKQLKQAADRLQLSNIKLIVQDAFKYGPVAPAYDRVLVDAPCSGWGVFGRKSELRWQVHQDEKELLKLQEKAMNYAANFVKPGGILLYSTCTMNPTENEEQIRKFLKSNKQFSLQDASNYLPSQYTEAGFFKTKPFMHFMDGAFAAR
ncbi:MAG: 16S rRNA (cytosine(967)-C(5))-methyltransferase RsmB, partial [Candidatus Cloacimonetes bacterium]|nr:16S rRNA (cytosine(967)-C(5))-methyltransferase RsmB [Candidatus Cloacimonadota bacterium]